MIIPLLIGLAALGSALIGGVFFAFSSFVMPALKRLPAGEGIAAMLAINVTVINWHFLGLFLGTALLCGGLLVAAWFGDVPMGPIVAGCLCYLLGTFGVTVAGNVPLNDALVAAGIPWADFVARWSAWNHVRTAAAILAAIAFLVGLRDAQG